MVVFKIGDKLSIGCRILTRPDGSCRPAHDTEISLWEENVSLQKELAERTAERDEYREIAHDRTKAWTVAESRADILAQALRAIVDTLDAEEMGDGPPASEWSKHWQKLHDDARAALGDRP